MFIHDPEPGSNPEEKNSREEAEATDRTLSDPVGDAPVPC